MSSGEMVPGSREAATGHPRSITEAPSPGNTCAELYVTVWLLRALSLGSKRGLTSPAQSGLSIPVWSPLLPLFSILRTSGHGAFPEMLSFLLLL